MPRNLNALIENGLASVFAVSLLIAPIADAYSFEEVSHQSGFDESSATPSLEHGGEHSDYRSVRVPGDQPWVLPAGVVVLHLNDLIVERGGRIIVTPQTSSVRLVVHGNSYFAEGARIEIRGANGSGAGAQGGQAASFEADLGAAKVLGLDVVSRGGDGAQGATGSPGANASRKRCTGDGGRRAGSGGRGGRGGDAGDGGDITIEYALGSDIVHLQARSIPGDPGAGGAGGRGGNGTSSVSCFGYRRGGHSAGHTGRTGSPGEAGREGDVVVTALSHS